MYIMPAKLLNRVHFTQAFQLPTIKVLKACRNFSRRIGRTAIIVLFKAQSGSLGVGCSSNKTPKLFARLPCGKSNREATAKS